MIVVKTGASGRSCVGPLPVIRIGPCPRVDRFPRLPPMVAADDGLAAIDFPFASIIVQATLRNPKKLCISPVLPVCNDGGSR